MEAKPTLHVRGSVNLDKYKAARTLAGDNVKFELRAIRQGAQASAAGVQAPSCLVCIICLICIVCSVATAKETGLALPPL